MLLAELQSTSRFKCCLRTDRVVSNQCQVRMKNSVLIVMAVMAGRVLVIVAVGDACAAEHCLAKIV